MLTFLALLAFLAVILVNCQSYMCVPKVLARQARRMHWEPVARTEEGDIYFLRGDNRAVVSWANKNVTVLDPLHKKPFQDFFEVEQWLEKGGKDTSSEDVIWGNVSDAEVEALQAVFMQVYAAENLEEYIATEILPTAMRIKFSEAANKAAREMGVNPALILLVIHQYIDSDCELRKGYRGEWVSFMMSRPSLAPQPETYMDYMNTTYFRK